MRVQIAVLALAMEMLKHSPSFEGSRSSAATIWRDQPDYVRTSWKNRAWWVLDGLDEQGYVVVRKEDR